MKIYKIFLGLALLVGAAGITVSCDKEEIVEANELPTISSAFLDEHFKSVKILSVTREKEGLSGTEYQVLLDNSVEVTFDKNGQWSEVDSKRNEALPTSFILAPIVSYVDSNYETASIVGIDIDNNTFEVELSNSLDLVFDTDGKFLRIDP